MTKVPGLPARRAALALLDAVLRKGLPLESGLASATKDIDRTEDRALAHAIASEVLRRTPDLDDLIDGTTRLRLADDAKVRMVLRMALVQALILGTPPHAVIATSLALLEGGPRRLAHGVLGSLLRSNARLRAVPMLLPKVEQRWALAWGDAMVADACMALSAQPPLDLTLREASETDQWAETLGGESLAPGHVRIKGDLRVPDLPGFADGAWWVQNVSASLPARLLGKGDGRSVLDLCAAPGGKTMQLAATGWCVTALEKDARRLRRVSENLERTRLSAELVAADMMSWVPERQFDAILLDAPCTATGIFARHPDVLHRVRPKDIAALAETQSALLARASAWLRPGGVLVYATCSLEPDEGERVAATCDLPIDPISDDDLFAELSPTPEGWLRVLPRPGLDGFFVARFRNR